MTSPQGIAQRGQDSSWSLAANWARPSSGGSVSLCWHWASKPRSGAQGAGQGRQRVWNILRSPRGQLVNFVGMHLVERRCINIRSLSAYCVSPLRRRRGWRAQMPFVKSTGMAWLRGVLGRSLLAQGQSWGQGRAQNLGRTEARPACLWGSHLRTVHQADEGTWPNGWNGGQGLPMGRSHWVLLCDAVPF